MSDETAPPIDQDDGATWPQLRDRLREIRAWAEDASAGGEPLADLLGILDRPRETL